MASESSAQGPVDRELVTPSVAVATPGASTSSPVDSLSKPAETLRPDSASLDAAYARFMEGIARKTAELRGGVEVLGFSPGDERTRDEVRRRLHALYASAQVFRLDPIAKVLQAAMVRLDAARENGRLLTEDDVAVLHGVVTTLREFSGRPSRPSPPSRTSFPSVPGAKLPSAPAVRPDSDPLPGLRPGPVSGLVPTPVALSSPVTSSLQPRRPRAPTLQGLAPVTSSLGGSAAPTGSFASDARHRDSVVESLSSVSQLIVADQVTDGSLRGVGVLTLLSRALSGGGSGKITLWESDSAVPAVGDAVYELSFDGTALVNAVERQGQNVRELDPAAVGSLWLLENGRYRLEEGGLDVKGRFRVRLDDLGRAALREANGTTNPTASTKRGAVRAGSIERRLWPASAWVCVLGLVGVAAYGFLGRGSPSNPPTSQTKGPSSPAPVVALAPAPVQREPAATAAAPPSAAGTLQLAVPPAVQYALRVDGEARAERPATLSLPAGPHEIEVTVGAETLYYSIVVEPGATHTVDVAVGGRP